MGWIAQRDRAGGQFNAGGLGGPTLHVDGGSVLARGAVLVEYAHVAGRGPRNLVRYMVRDPRPAALTLRLDPDGTLRLLVRSGAMDAAYAMQLPPLVPGETVLVRYVWDTVAASAVLAVTMVERDLHQTMPLQDVVPMTLFDVERVTMTALCQLDAAIRSVAIADDVVPVGPMPGLDGRSRIMTRQGVLPISAVRAGDIVIAADGKAAQVRWAGAVILPAVGVYQPVMLHAPYYNVTQDMALSGDQQLHLSGSEVEYLFACENVAVRMRDLADDRAAVQQTGQPVVRYHQMLLDRAVPLCVDGALVAPLNPGPFVADPVLSAHSVLAELPRELLPRFEIPRGAALQSFEAQTLRRLRAA